MIHNLKIFVFLFLNFLFSQSIIEVPPGTKIEVPNGAYLCAESIEVNGELISIPQNLCVSPNGEEIARILMVTSLNDNGRYKIGDEISVSVMYSKNVMVIGSPNIALNTNNPPSDGKYQSGSGSNELVFNYIVKEGDNTLDLEYVSSMSLVLNEGSIFTMDSEAADNILPLPGSQGSLSQNKDIILDGVYPTIISITPQDGNTLLLGKSPIIDIVFSEELSKSEIELIQSHGDLGFFSQLNGNRLSVNFAGVLSTSNNSLSFSIDNTADLAGNFLAPISFSYQVSALADFNLDNKIDVEDLSDFSQSWNSKNYSKELGPADGIVPYLTLKPDGKFDLEDVMAFTRMWHWSQKNNSSFQFISNEGISINASQEGEKINISWHNSADAVELILNYNPDELSIVKDNFNQNFDYLNLSKLDTIAGNFNISRASLNSKISNKANVKIMTKNDNNLIVDISYKLINEFGDIIGIGTKSVNIESIPSQFRLHDNYPNPFNPSTTISFDLPESSYSKIIIFNMAGQKIKEYDLNKISAGNHSITWDATNSAGDPIGAGVYFYQLQTNNFTKTKKMVLLK